MGIRVHKALGYGTDTIKLTKEDGVDDPRLNTDIFYTLNEEYGALDIKDLLKRVDDAKNDIIELHHILKNSVAATKKDIADFDWGWFRKSIYDATDLENPDHLIHWDTEYGIPNVMLFRPFCRKDWLRYDDQIDYNEERGNRCKFLNAPLYPHTWWTKIAEPTTKLEGRYTAYTKDGKFQFIEGGDYNMLVGRWDDRTPPIAKGKDLEHFENNYRPVFPIDLTAVLWFYSPAFKDIVEFANTLRPMIYVYWS